MSQSMAFLATVLFAFALLHTFSVKWFQKIASTFKPGSLGENFFHLLGEIEVVFGLWAFIFISFLFLYEGSASALHFMESQNYTEPAFIFVIMAICSTKPILELTEQSLMGIAKILPLKPALAFIFVLLAVAPLLGSFITEPAAMTVVALILQQRFYSEKTSLKLKYATLGVLFVNISIGGTLTPFAAPPILMVAQKWNWDFSHMLVHFGWKGALACVITTALLLTVFKKEISKLPINLKRKGTNHIPAWVSFLHLLFLVAVVFFGHHLIMFIFLFLFFLGLFSVTQEYQENLKLKESLLVAFFLAGLVLLGTPQKWWLQPLLTQMKDLPLFLAAIGLTSITDNAALTFLGAQVEGLSEASKYFLVTGSVVGGGLTVIANAPNPVGYGILNPAFEKEGIQPLYLFIAALPATLIAGLCFWFF